MHTFLCRFRVELAYFYYIVSACSVPVSAQKNSIHEEYQTKKKRTYTHILRLHFVFYDGFFSSCAGFMIPLNSFKSNPNGPFSFKFQAN